MYVCYVITTGMFNITSVTLGRTVNYVNAPLRRFNVKKNGLYPCYWDKVGTRATLKYRTSSIHFNRIKL